MKIPSHFQMPAMIGSVVVILILLVSFFWRGDSEDLTVYTAKYETRKIDAAVAQAAAQEAIRLTGGAGNVVLLLNVPGKPTGSFVEQQSQAYRDGFEESLRNHGGSGIKIVGTKHRATDTSKEIFSFPWPTPSVLMDIAREFPSANLYVSFCRAHEFTGDDAPQLRANNVPPLVIVDNSVRPGVSQQTIMASGAVAVLFTQNPRLFARGVPDVQGDPQMIVQATYFTLRR